MLVYLVILVCLQNVLLSSSAFSRCANTLRRKRAPKNRYKLVSAELQDVRDWPPLGSVIVARGDGTDAVTMVTVIDNTTSPTHGNAQ